MTYLDYNEVNGRCLTWSMIHYNKRDRDNDVYAEHRGDGMCLMFFSKDDWHGNMYSFLDSGHEEEVIPQMKYMNNAYRTKSDII